MATVTGIGGFFFRSKDPGALALWYEDHFGILQVPSDYGGAVWRQEAGVTVFAPFPEDTGMFGAPDRQFMLNFRVPDLPEAVEDLRAAGISVEVDPETYPNGVFASLTDPEGNPIQLWEPRGPEA
ncbi:VOC family protein [Maritimibacter sp. DP1N21-5]|uniref:VOC family protein n=1 Tax=Maritimibacter sp. DP1N21-5 TaxID=2836867 RepID=UPI001C48797F|nr:VOC family protein [Maritimibacter sp. DP1N21-5]MBV7410310.1 VOC family protein [Maritimibacter sp. DP1N21-5]